MAEKGHTAVPGHMRDLSIAREGLALHGDPGHGVCIDMLQVLKPMSTLSERLTAQGINIFVQTVTSDTNSNSTKTEHFGGYLSPNLSC